ncbi:MAG: hypothetical protein ACRETS_09850 [Steroidobacteraceae bacterium]
MKKQAVWLLATLAVVLMLGCSSAKAPAEQAVAGAETALAAIQDDAQKYAPDQLVAVQTQLQNAKDSYAKGDYQAVVAAAPALSTAIAGMKDAVASKKAEAEAALAKAKNDWGPLGTDVPKMVEEIGKRVETLAKSRHLPKGVTKDAVASAKSGLDALKTNWGDAVSASTSGDFTTAMSKGQAVKDQAMEMMKSLGMPGPK